MLTAERLREILHYEPETGRFTRKARTAQRHKIGDRADFLIATGKLLGYYRISVDSERYLAHRAAWLYMNGEWPNKEIDHRDGDRSNNRISNLRDVPHKMNMENRRTAQLGNLSGFLGVATHAPGVYRASVQVSSKRVHVGLYDTPQEAHGAYVAAKRILHEGCTL